LFLFVRKKKKETKKEAHLLPILVLTKPGGITEPLQEGQSRSGV
jgi:hypothetical protein